MDDPRYSNVSEAEKVTNFTHRMWLEAIGSTTIETKCDVIIKIKLSNKKT